MTTRSNFSACSLLAITVAAGLLAPSAATAQTVADRALSELRVDSVGDCSTVTVTFNIRVQLVSFFPEASGRELHIRVLPLDGTIAPQGRDSLRTPTNVPELRSVQYEGDNPAGPVLSLFFTRNTGFTVQAGSTPQQIVIKLAAPGSAACSAATAASTTPANTSAGSPAQPSPGVAIPAGLYVINLLSTPDASPPLTAAQQQALSDVMLYESQFEKGAQDWHRLRAGFFETREAAEAARQRLISLYPDAWVVKVSADERAEGVAARLTTPASVMPAAPAMAGTQADEAETKRLTDDAEQAIRDGNLDRAVQLLTNAIDRPETAASPRARELLGLTRERKGQQAQAQAEYEEYLRRYGSGEGADRVRERLAALGAATSGAATTGKPLRAASDSTNTAKGWSWGLRGSFSQFYFRDQGRTTNFTTNSTLGTEVDRSVNVNQLLTAGDVTISGGDDRRQLQLRAAGSYTRNFGTSSSISTINNGAQQLTFRSKPGGGLGAVTALYLDYADSDLNSSLRIGRQTRNSAGVLGRFDGALFGFQANPHLRFNAVAGFPVLSSHQLSVLKERPFYGVSVDFGNRRSPLQTTLYWFDQRAKGGFVDRQSVGLEVRYLKKSFNAYSMIDYDVKFRQVNLALLSLNYTFPDTASLSFTADYRRSPLLTTTNALLNQSVAALDPVTHAPIFTLATDGSAVQNFLRPDQLGGLRPFFTDPQIYQLALDRTLIAKSYTVTYARPITRKLQISADFNLTDTGGTPGLAAKPYVDLTNTLPPLLLYSEISPMPAIGKEYYYGLQLIGSGLIWGNDIYILSGRYSNTSNSRIYTGDFNARIPLTSKFRLSPRLRYGFRDDKPTRNNPVPGSFTQLQPTLRMNYYPVRHSELEVELGGNFTSQRVFDSQTATWGRLRERGWVLSAGYRLDF